MATKKTRADIFREAVGEFHNSKHGVEDYMAFLLAGTRAVRQGDGLLWSSVEEIIKEALAEMSTDEQKATQKMVDGFFAEGDNNA